MDAVLYIHGKNGSAEEAGRYVPLFPACSVTGLHYAGSTPWEAGKEIREAIIKLKKDHGKIIVIANSIGAYFLMQAGVENSVAHAYFISPVVDMEKIIADMIERAGIREADLQSRKIIRTEQGDDLSWEYLCYIREHPIQWRVPTDILYGSKDPITSMAAITEFARRHGASLTVMENGEHWFHTKEQMQFLDRWLMEKR